MNFKKKVIFLLLSFLAIGGGCFIFPFFSPSYHACIPIKFKATKTPFAEIEIEGEKYPVLIDLGSHSELFLEKNVLENIQKVSKGISFFRDMRGKQYQTTKFLIPKIKLDSFAFKNVEVRETNSDFETATVIYQKNANNSKIETVGILGRGLLKRTKILLDFPHSQIFLSNREGLLKKLGYNVKNWVKIPFQLDDLKGISFEVETDFGRKKFGLDTGLTVTLLRDSDIKNQENLGERYGMKVLSTSKFVIGGYDFGKKNLYLFDLTSELDIIDGEIGMDFLSSCPIYLDFQAKIAYIKPFMKEDHLK